MSASHTSGYQGFKPFGAQVCSTLKPGETYEGRASKFAKMGSHIITPVQYNQVGRQGFESIAAQSMQTVQPSDYKVPDIRGLNGKERSELVIKKFVTTSTYLNDYPSYTQEMQNVIATDLVQFERAFHRVTEECENNGIELAHVPSVVKLALGDAAVPRIIDLFITFFDHGHAVSSSFKDNITWEIFRTAVDHIISIFEQELGKISGRSTVITFNKSDPNKIIAASTPASSYQVDYGQYGDQPLERPYVRRRGMASTTDDIQTGTPKETHHIPGYMGFLPQTTHNPDAVAHSQGTDLRGRKNELRLYHSDNLFGYTGHKPVDCKNYRGECRAGSNPSTSTGSSYIPHL